jgi:hypothetical protein
MAWRPDRDFVTHRLIELAYHLLDDYLSDDDHVVASASSRQFVGDRTRRGDSAGTLSPASVRGRNRIGVIVEFADNARLPAIRPAREFLEFGGLMAYGFDIADVTRHAAQQIDLILRGRKPARFPSTNRPSSLALSENDRCSRR